MEFADNAHIIQFKNHYDVWVTDTVELAPAPAFRRASHILQFDYDNVRVITPDGVIIEDEDIDMTGYIF
tara:strand:+ start:726 stop:932 length:207 start_codon:yes stop_codon:yes gene_type:complete